jgi:hypothetical protein
VFAIENGICEFIDNTLFNVNIFALLKEGLEKLFKIMHIHFGNIVLLGSASVFDEIKLEFFILVKILFL